MQKIIAKNGSDLSSVMMFMDLYLEIALALLIESS
jgi:hypothetical protein